jgi:hypothetical protein
MVVLDLGQYLTASVNTLRMDRAASFAARLFHQGGTLAFAAVCSEFAEGF